MLRVVQVCFLIFSLPLLHLTIVRPRIDSIPPIVLYGYLFPISIWHFTSVILTLIWGIGKLVKLPFLSFIWALTKFKRTKKMVVAVKSNERYQAFDARRRLFIQQGMTAVAGTILTTSTYSAYRRDHYEQPTVRIPIKNLPPAFEGFTICLLTDIHSGVFMTKERMRRYVEAANRMKTDLIAVTGDFVNGQLDEVYPFAETFTDLKAPYGVYGVLGNHDFYTRKVDTVAREIDDCGVKLLRNDGVVLEKDGQKLNLLGVDDIGRNDPVGDIFDTALRAGKPNAPNVLLCHRPYYFEDAAARNIDLTLSGHTHGGQVVFMKLGTGVITPARVASQYVAGTYTIGTSSMYVSRGIGTVGVPIRINCPPEVTRIVLTRAQAA